MTKPFNVSNGPLMLSNCRIPEIITGIDPHMNIFDVIILFSGLFKYFWNPQKKKNNGIQFNNPTNESEGSQYDLYNSPEFSKCFKKANTVLLCPIYTANEKIRLNFTYHSFAKLIIKNSKVKLIQVNNESQLRGFIRQNVFGKKIYIGMGAGSISNWMRNLKNIF